MAQTDHTKLGNPVKELKLLPQLLPMKLGNALLLQYILHQSDRDNLGLLPLGFAVGITSLVISIHSAAMDYIFKSFGHVFRFHKEKVRKVRAIANWVNNFLCLVQVVLVNILFIFCVTYYNSVSYDDEKSKYFVIKRVFMLSFLVSMMTFGCTIIAIGAAVFLYCLHNTLVKANLVVKKEEVDIRESNLPPPAIIRVIIAESVFTASFYIIEGQPMDICWGNDLLRELGYEINLGTNILKIGGQTVPILEGDELPQNIEILRQHGPIDPKTGKLAK